MFDAAEAARLSERNKVANGVGVLTILNRIKDFISNTEAGKQGIRECTVVDPLTDAEISYLRGKGFRVEYRNSQTFICW